jgi:hypothetical protein
LPCHQLHHNQNQECQLSLMKSALERRKVSIQWI